MTAASRTEPFAPVLAGHAFSRRALGALAGGSALAALLAHPTPSRARQATNATPVAGGTLIYARNIDAKTLDPHFSTQWSERYVLYCLYDTLVSWDTDFNIIPALAESWEIAADGMAITFALHPNVLFHDGTPCDAEAVKWNLERVLNPDTGSNQSGQLEPAVETVTAVDAVTLEIALKRPWRPLKRLGKISPALRSAPGPSVLWSGPPTVTSPWSAIPTTGRQGSRTSTASRCATSPTCKCN